MAHCFFLFCRSGTILVCMFGHLWGNFLDFVVATVFICVGSLLGRFLCLCFAHVWINCLHNSCDTVWNKFGVAFGTSLWTMLSSHFRLCGSPILNNVFVKFWTLWGSHARQCWCFIVFLICLGSHL